MKMKKLLFLTLLLSAIGMKGWADQYPAVLYAVGDATSTGWTAGGNNILYKYSGENKYQGFVSFTSTSGELKFLCQEAWGDMWGATSKGDGVSTDTPNTVVYHGGGSDDFKFKPTFAIGLYLVTIDATTEGSETVTFKQWNNSTDVYEIGNAAQLSAFANAINNFETSINAKLTADVDWGTTNIMIGGNASDDSDYAQAYKGTFDGQGHTLTYSLSRTENYASLFKNLDGATIQNLKVAGSVTHHTNKSKYTASIFGKAYNSSVVKNCVSTVTLTNYTDEDATMGGIGALMYDSGSKIENCAFLGTMTGDWGGGKPYGVGGILGWASDANVVVENCYVNGTIDVADNNTNIVIVRSNDITPTNCYYLNNGNLNGQTGATLIDASLMSSGELAYKLNGSADEVERWYQVIGTDTKPEPFAKDGGLVYFNQNAYCDGETYAGGIYSNASGNHPTGEHHLGVSGLYNDGFCTNCQYPNPDYLTKDGDYYQIGTGNGLKWFAYWVNRAGNTDAKGKLTANIDMNGVDYSGIGNATNQFAGELKGDGSKIISNLTMDIDGDNVGLIGVATDGADVEDITLDFTCSFKGKSNVAAFIGKLDGNGSATLKQCGNEASVTATVANAAGLVGYATSNDAAPEFTNCYNVGDINSAGDNSAAGLSVHTEYAKFKNCYNYLDASKCSGLKIGTGEDDGKYWSFALGEHMTINDGDYTNNWDNLTWWIPNKVTLANMADGTLRTNLGTTYYTNMVYGAKAHPGFAAQINIELREDAVNTLPNENMTSMNMKLYRSLTKETWNSICLPFDLDADGIEEVFGEGTKVAAFASVNGVNNDNLHFGQVTSISARTPYLIYPANNRPYSEPIVLSGITIQPSPETVTKGGFNFTGIYSSTPITGKYFIASGNTIKKSTGGNLKGFRAYIEDTTAEARTLTFDFFDDVTTGVKDAKHLMNSGLLTTDNVYDLQGRRIANPTKGLYIVNGKKVIIK
jgi:hypothetical protein